MAKVSANYEVVYIIDPAQGEENTAALVAKFKTLAEQNGSAVEVEEWGSRKLAYPINYKNEGYYVLMTFTSEPPFPKELDRCSADHRRHHAFPDRLQGPVREAGYAQQDHHHGSSDPGPRAAPHPDRHRRRLLLPGSGPGL